MIPVQSEGRVINVLLGHYQTCVSLKMGAYRIKRSHLLSWCQRSDHSSAAANSAAWQPEVIVYVHSTAPCGILITVLLPTKILGGCRVSKVRPIVGAVTVRTLDHAPGLARGVLLHS